MFMIVGSAVFLGCPIKVMLRLAGGDLTAVAGLAGLVAGVWLGVLFLRRGFTLGRPGATRPMAGWILPGFMVFLALAALWGPVSFRGGLVPPASEHPWVTISLGLGLLVGGLSQRSSFCVTGGIRNFFLTKDLSMISGVGLLFLSALGLNVLFGYFEPGLVSQPGSHLDHGWSVAGMALVGFGATLIGGCPFRQLVMAGEGDTDAGIAVLGMLVGGGIVHSWLLRSTLAGVTPGGKMAVALGFLMVVGVGVVFRERG